MLDLGRPERVIVAATHYNFTSVFAWNMFLYSGMAAIVVVYLWTLMERRMARWSRYAGMAAFAWRIILTSGTGSIFAFLVARQAYGTAILVPLFLAMSFAWGLAVFLVVQSALYRWNGLPPPAAIRQRMQNLLGLFVVAVLFFVLVYHLTSIYFAKQTAFERFILRDGGVYPQLFWWGYVVAGSLVPLFLVWRPGVRRQARRARGAAPRDRRRIRAALRLHHRRTGVSARPLSGFRDDEQLRRRAGALLCAEPAGSRAGARGTGRRLPDHARRRAGVRLPPARRSRRAAGAE